MYCIGASSILCSFYLTWTFPRVNYDDSKKDDAHILCESPEIWTGKIDLQFFFIFAANDVVEHHGKIIEFLEGGGCTADLRGQFTQSALFSKKGGMPQQDFNSFSIRFYYIFSTTYQRFRDLFCPVIYLEFRTVCPGNLRQFETIFYTGKKSWQTPLEMSFELYKSALGKLRCSRDLP